MSVPQPSFDPTPPPAPADGSTFSSALWQRWLSRLGSNLKQLMAWLQQQLALLAPLASPSFTGDASSAGRFLVADGSAAAPAFGFSNEPAKDMGLYRAAAGKLGMAVGGTEVLELSSSLVLGLRPLRLVAFNNTPWPLQVLEQSGGLLVQLTGTGPNASKSLRCIGGTLDILNSAGTTSIWSLTDDGHMTTPYAAQVSDERLKRAWRRLPAGLVEGMAGLKQANRAGLFTWKADGKRTIGLGAQSVQSFCPAAVLEGASGQLSVMYGTLAALTAVELCERVLQAESQVKRLEEDLRALVDRVGQLEWREGRR